MIKMKAIIMGAFISGFIAAGLWFVGNALGSRVYSPKNEIEVFYSHIIGLCLGLLLAFLGIGTLFLFRELELLVAGL